MFDQRLSHLRHSFASQSRKNSHTQNVIKLRNSLQNKLDIINGFGKNSNVGNNKNINLMTIGEYIDVLLSKDKIVQMKVGESLGSRFEEGVKHLDNIECLKMVYLITKHVLFQTRLITEEVIGKIVGQIKINGESEKQQTKLLVWIIIQCLSKNLDQRLFKKLDHNIIIKSENYFESYQMFYIYSLRNYPKLMPQFDTIKSMLLNQFDGENNNNEMQQLVVQIIISYLLIDTFERRIDCIKFSILIITKVLNSSSNKQLQSHCLSLLGFCISLDPLISLYQISSRSLLPKIIHLSKYSIAKTSMPAIQVLSLLIIYISLEQPLISSSLSQINQILKASLNYNDPITLGLSLKSIAKIINTTQSTTPFQGIQHRLQSLQRHQSKEVYHWTQILIDSYFNQQFYQSNNQRQEQL